ncbi:hypothetical protein KW801_00120 [Candidatus Saccharibacteria bacterium]|nr:hypothetical protein [Candidatus Saccharibacteria bacterium]
MEKFISAESAGKALQDCRFSGGIAASTIDGEFGGARITRDYLAVMSDLMESQPGLVREGFSQIPKEQGIEFDSATDQQLNRLPHQVAYNMWDGRRVPCYVSENRREWAKKWGIPFDEQNGFIVWNQTDASQYVHELRRFVDLYGTSVLNDKFIHKPTQEIRTVKEAALRQLDWMVSAIEDSNLGLLEVQEFNSRQTSWSGVMRDGYDAYFHPKGEYGYAVNKDKPIAYFENQAWATQAFLDAIYLFKHDERSEISGRRSKWQDISHDLPQRAFDLFRIDKEDYFAAAIDRGENGQPQKVDQISVDIAKTLAAPEFYHNLTDKTVNPDDVLAGIVRKIFSPAFMTPAGLRMLDLRHSSQEGDYFAYQASKAVWPYIQFKLSNALRGIHLPELALEIELNRAIPAIENANSFTELGWVTPEGIVLYQPAPDITESAIEIAAEQWPSRNQAWTISGVSAALSAAKKRFKKSESWHRNVTDEALAGIKDIKNISQLTSEEFLPYRIDFEAGRRLGRQRAIAMGGITLSE